MLLGCLGCFVYEAYLVWRWIDRLGVCPYGWVVKWRYQLQPWLERCPRVYLASLHVKRFFDEERSRVVTRGHDCVIEGFPRSANSFAYRAFDQANGGCLKIGTHTHSPAQVVQAVRWGVPCMVLIRHPFDAVVGDLAFSRHMGVTLGDGVVVAPGREEVLCTLRRWCWFYGRLCVVREGVFFAVFDDVVADFSAVSRDFVGYAGRGWRAYDASVVAEEDILSGNVYMAPSVEREGIKAVVREAVEGFGLEDGFEAAEVLYGELIGRGR